MRDSHGTAEAYEWYVHTPTSPCAPARTLGSPPSAHASTLPPRLHSPRTKSRPLSFYGWRAPPNRVGRNLSAQRVLRRVLRVGQHAILPLHLPIQQDSLHSSAVGFARACGRCGVRPHRCAAGGLSISRCHSISLSSLSPLLACASTARANSPHTGLPIAFCAASPRRHAWGTIGRGAQLVVGLSLKRAASPPAL